MGWGSAVKTAPTPKASKTQQASTPRIVFPLAKIDWKRLVTLDFESYYDSDYTLRKLNTSEYVRDERFKAHMVGVKVGTGKTKVIPAEKIKAFLKTIDWSTHGLLCHNAPFDGFILSHHYGVVPKFYYDTLAMARGLHSNDIGAGLDEVAQYYGRGSKIDGVLIKSQGIRDLPPALYKEMAEYCAQDVELTLAIFKDMLEKFPEGELRLVNLTTALFADPKLKIDLPRVEAEYIREKDYKEGLLLSFLGTPKQVEKLIEQPVTSFMTGVGDKARFKKKDLDDLRMEPHEVTTRAMLLLHAKRKVGSNEQFAELLRAEGIEPPTKISPTWIKKRPSERTDEGKYTYAFAKDDLEFLALRDMSQKLSDLVDLRLAVKSTQGLTRAERFLKAGMNGWSLPVLLHYYGAHTGRWSAGNKMNLQNLERGGELRKSILAPPGYMIAVNDSGQIEARVNAWISGQTDLLDSFRAADAFEARMAKLPKAERRVATGDERDAYCKFADTIYGREILKTDEMERFVGKVGVLGLGYMMGPPKLQMTLAKGALGGPPVFFELDMCQKIVYAYRRKNNMIAKFWELCGKTIIPDMAAGRSGSYKCLHWEKEKIWLPNGMCLKYPGLKCEHDGEYEEWTYLRKGNRTKIYGGLLCENIVQALARIIIAEQMLMIAEKYRVVMTTHDEVSAIVKKAQAKTAFAFMQKCMATAPTWCPDLPLNSDGKVEFYYAK